MFSVPVRHFLMNRSSVLYPEQRRHMQFWNCAAVVTFALYFLLTRNICRDCIQLLLSVPGRSACSVA